ncbi:MAG: hypothetical protein IPJ65_24680 [Archangiaceae bacterium]|nr:hypothetical protein [Archangiaceae bacterium]
MERENVLLGVVLAACAAAVVAVMLLPPAVRRSAAEVEPTLSEDEPVVRISPTRPAPRPAAAVKPRPAPQGSDAGVVTVEPRTEVLATFAWGAGKGQLGRARPRDGNPEAPMSLDADANDTVWLLDQVNRRVVKVDARGKPVGELPVGLSRPVDLQVLDDGNLAVLDRAAERAVAVLGPDGKRVAEYKLVEPARVSAVVVDGDDVYAEREGGTLNRLGDSQGHADGARTEAPGRPTRDGRAFVTATLTDGAHGVVVLKAIDRRTGDERFTREVRLGMSVLRIALLGSDRSGLIYLAAQGERVPPDRPSAEPKPTVDLLCLDASDGRPLSRTELQANTSADQTLRELAVLESGGVVYLRRTETSAELQRVDCR